MKFRVLGNFQIGRDDAGYTIAAPKQRQLLALLLLNANTAVSPQTCFRELWDEHPPLSAATTLQTYIMNLRRALAESDGERPRIVLEKGGYRLFVDDGELDLDVFDADVARARAAEGTEALDILSAALDLWPGSMLSDVTQGPVVSALVATHEHRHTEIVYEKFDLMLELGRARPSLPALKRAVEQHPGDERLRCQLMRALFSTGRRAESILQFQSLRSYLQSELRVEPGSATTRLARSLRES